MAANRNKAVMTLKLRVEIGVDIEAEDYIAAAAHQRRLEHLLDLVRTEYAQATMTLVHLRTRGAPLAPRRHRGRRATGAVAGYVEA